MVTVALDDFYPRSPCGERPEQTAREQAIAAISIHALLAESDITNPVPRRGRAISIHALLAESDASRRYPVILGLEISIHALLAESDAPPYNLMIHYTISIHALLAESDSAFDVLAVSALLISIHALLAESDAVTTLGAGSVTGFLSTLSLRRAT